MTEYNIEYKIPLQEVIFGILLFCLLSLSIHIFAVLLIKKYKYNITSVRTLPDFVDKDILSL